MASFTFILICPVVIRGDTSHPHYQMLAVLPAIDNPRWQLLQGLGHDEASITVEAVKTIQRSVGNHKIAFTDFVLPRAPLGYATGDTEEFNVATPPVQYGMVFPVLFMWDVHEYQLSRDLQDYRWLDSSDILQQQVPCLGPLTYAAKHFFGRIKNGERVRALRSI